MADNKMSPIATNILEGLADTLADARGERLLPSYTVDPSFTVPISAIRVSLISFGFSGSSFSQDHIRVEDCAITPRRTLVA